MFGHDWKIKIVKEIQSDNQGGSFSWTKKEIVLSKKYGEQESILLHEIMEAILLHLNLRFYGGEGSMEYIFNFNHTQFVAFHQILFQVLKDNKLI